MTIANSAASTAPSTIPSQGVTPFSVTSHAVV